MPIWANWLLLLGGLVIITLGGNKFTDSAVFFAQRARIPKIIIGVTLVSLCTTLPEFMVSVTSAIYDRPQTTMGDAIGSTICNIGLILGLCLLIKPASPPRRLLLRYGLIMCFVGVAITLLSLDGYLSRWDAVGLSFGLVAYIYYSIKQAGAEHQSLITIEYAPSASTSSLTKEVAWLTLGSCGVVVGAILIVRNMFIIAHWLGIPELVIALTMIAVGTSLPELVVGLTATIKDHGDITVGNMVGANILDILWVRGIGGLGFSLLPVEHQTQVLDYPAMLALMIVLVMFAITAKGLSRWNGGILFAMYVSYVAVMFLLFR